MEEHEQLNGEDVEDEEVDPKNLATQLTKKARTRIMKKLVLREATEQHEDLDKSYFNASLKNTYHTTFGDSGESGSETKMDLDD